jgi:hypothetical protein
VLCWLRRAAIIGRIIIAQTPVTSALRYTANLARARVTGHSHGQGDLQRFSERSKDGDLRASGAVAVARPRLRGHLGSGGIGGLGAELEDALGVPVRHSGWTAGANGAVRMNSAATPAGSNG